MANGSNMFSVYCRLFLHFPGELFVLAKRDTEVPSLKTYLQLKNSPFIFFISLQRWATYCSAMLVSVAHFLYHTAAIESHLNLMMTAAYAFLSPMIHILFCRIYMKILGGGALFSHKVNESDENILDLPLHPDLCWNWMGFSSIHAPPLHQIPWNPLTSFCFMHNQ